MSQKKLSICVINQFDALHKFKDAPEEVSYLRNLHRHTFIVTSKIEVFHEDRELEFYMVKDYIKTLLDDTSSLGGNMSCENICSYVLQNLKNKYGTNRDYIISCSEDGQNKAILEETK